MRLSFDQRIDRTGNCWLWTGAVSTTGYGRTGRSQYAHRVSYETSIGPIPDGYHIDHLCRVPLCVNPSHLEAVPQRINTLRGMSWGAVVARTNRCIRDHEFTPENTYDRPDGQGRQCRECHRIRRRRRDAAVRLQAVR